MEGKTLAAMAAEVEAVNRKLGWYDQEVPFPEAVALLHSEVSEALEAWRQWGLWDGTYHVSAEKYVRGENLNGRPPKPEGVGSEFADVFIRLLHYSALFGIDLEAEYERKLAYNRTRPYRHGEKRA